MSQSRYPLHRHIQVHFLIPQLLAHKLLSHHTDGVPAVGIFRGVTNQAVGGQCQYRQAHVMEVGTVLVSRGYMKGILTHWFLE